MPLNEDPARAEQFGELRSDVRHIQADVTEIKAEVRAVNQRIDVLRSELTAKIDSLKDSLASARVWALTLYIALAGALLLVLARGFKWI